MQATSLRLKIIQNPEQKNAKTSSLDSSEIYKTPNTTIDYGNDENSEIFFTPTSDFPLYKMKSLTNLSLLEDNSTVSFNNEQSILKMPSLGNLNLTDYERSFGETPIELIKNNIAIKNNRRNSKIQSLSNLFSYTIDNNENTKSFKNDNESHKKIANHQHRSSLQNYNGRYDQGKNVQLVLNLEDRFDETNDDVFAFSQKKGSDVFKKPEKSQTRILRKEKSSSSIEMMRYHYSASRDR